MTVPDREEHDRSAGVGRYALPVDAGLTESQRFPLLTDAGRQLLRRLRNHPSAPTYNFAPGDRLSAEGLRTVRSFEAELMSGDVNGGWGPASRPAWIDQFVAWAYRDVPYFRQRGAPPRDWSDVPLTDRSSLEGQPWAFVPDSRSLDDLIVYATSGTGGTPMPVLSHPTVPTMYLALLRWALERRGRRLEGGPGNVAIAQIAYQRYTFVYATVSSYLDQAGSVKVNLQPDGWRRQDDIVRFLDDCRPEIIAGDPIAFAALLRSPLVWRPKALVSTSMALPPTLRQDLVGRFDCPVLDLYFMTESGPIALDDGDGWVTFPRRLFVETVDEAGRQLPPGERGEIVLTGGFNPFLPLLRYRTGDFGVIAFRGGLPTMRNLELRTLVVFRGLDGRFINNIDVSQALEPSALRRFSLHQQANGDLTLAVAADVATTEPLRTVLVELFGVGQRVTIEQLNDRDSPSRFVPYSSDLPDASGLSAVPSKE